MIYFYFYWCILIILGHFIALSLNFEDGSQLAFRNSREERQLSSKPSRKIIMHIGPHKTGSTHIHSYLEKIKDVLLRHNYCWPVKGTLQNSNMLAIHFLSNRTVHNVSVEWLHECLNTSRNIILSAEAFDRFNLDNFREFYDYFPPNQFEFEIVIIYREWLNHMYSLYTEIHKYTSHGTSFSEYLFKNIDFLESIPVLNMTQLVSAYAPIVGMKNIHIFDYYGIMAAGKDEAYVLVCEVMKILCQESEYLNKKQIKENERPNMIASELFQIIRNHAHLLGCKLLNDRNRDFLTEFVKSYRQVNLTVPIASSNLKLFYPISSQIDSNYRHIFGDNIVYGNRTANLIAMRALNISEINKLAFFYDPDCMEWIYQEIKLQIKLRRFFNCTKSIVTRNEIVEALHHRRRHNSNNNQEMIPGLDFISSSKGGSPNSNNNNGRKNGLRSSNGAAGGERQKNISSKILDLRKKIAQSLGVNPDSKAHKEIFD